MNKKVKNYAVHQTFEMDLQNVWLHAWVLRPGASELTPLGFHGADFMGRKKAGMQNSWY